MASEPCVLGIDPGATNTGWVVLHEETGTVLHSSTIKRSPEMKPFTWAMLCVETTKNAVEKFNIKKVGVEGVEEPNIYHNGKKSVLRPLFLINTAVVAGVYAAHWQHMNPVIVRPAKNGSGSKESYPEALLERRPKDLDGIPLPGQRNHERSSYDVALKTILRYKEEYLYDQIPDALKGEPEAINIPAEPTKTKEKVLRKPAKKISNTKGKTVNKASIDMLSKVSSVR